MINQNFKTVSSLLQELQNKASEGSKITIEQIFEVFGVYGFALLILVLSLLNMIIFMVPGFSLIFGLPAVILAAQMVLGFNSPLLPNFIRKLSISSSLLEKSLKAGILGIKRLEKLVKPRFSFIAGKHADRIHGFLALMMAVQMALPIPVLNLSPSLGLVILTLGLMQRDGIFIAGAYAIGMWNLWIFGSLGRIAHFLVQQ